MRRRYTRRGSCRKASQKQWRERQAGKGRQIQLLLDPEEMVAMLQQSVNDFATEVGLKVARLLLDDEVEQRCGARYERVAERTVTRYGRQPGVVVIAGQKLPIERPRVRYTQRCGEVELENYARLQSPEAMGVPELLRRTLATTNPIESAFSVAENVTRRVKRWRDGDMRKRWCTAGLLRAESKFRRVKGHRHMPQLLKALDRLVLGKGLDQDRKIA